MRNRIYHRVTNFVAGLTDIADGLVSVLTLGFWQTDLTFKWLCYRTRKFSLRKIMSSTSNKKR